jgi:hypothetical protein
MNKTSAAILMSALLLMLLATLPSSASPSITTDPCACEATDGSCSVNVDCRGKCTKHCGTNGDCWVECSGFYGAFGLETNLEMPYGNESQFASLLAETTGQEIAFTKSKSDPTRDGVLFHVGFKKAPLWDALEFLANRGTVKISGRDFESIRRLRKALLSGQRFNFGVSNTPVNVFVTDLAGVTGLPFQVATGNPMTIANVQLPDANLAEIIAEVSKQTETTIIERGRDANGR